LKIEDGEFALSSICDPQSSILEHLSSLIEYLPEANMIELGLNTGGWIFLVAAWSAIIVVTLFCFKRVLSTHNQKKE
jgi:hypothetical protein